MEKNLMRWQEGRLYLSPKGNKDFRPFYEFPEVIGNVQISGVVRATNLDSQVSEVLGFQIEPLNYSEGWHTYQHLHKKGWKLG